MFINDVLRRVKNAYPSEYDAAEMYMWCDEVSSMLTQEDREIHRRAVLPVSEDGTFLLPEGVTQEYVTSVSAGSSILDYTDYRMYGHKDIYIKGRQGMRIENTSLIPTSVTVNYTEPYKPIRMVKYQGSVYVPETSESDGTLAMYTDTSAQFITGDTVDMELIDSSGTYYIEQAYISSAGPQVTDEVTGIKTPVMMAYTVLPGTITDKDGSAAEWTPSGSMTGTLRRRITERTVCDAPFDSMYVDYILSMIHTYQHDKVTANDYMTRFNSRLSAYRDWLIKRMPSGDNSIKNWW